MIEAPRAADRIRPMIAVELRKLVRSRRTWITIAMIDALPTLVAVLLALTDIGPRPGTGPAFLSAVLTDGFFSRPSLLQVGLRPLAPSVARIDACLRRVGVTGLAKGALVEIDMVARRPAARRCHSPGLVTPPGGKSHTRPTQPRHHHSFHHRLRL